MERLRLLPMSYSVAVPFLGNVTRNSFQWLFLEPFSTHVFLLEEGPKTWHSSCTYEVKMRKWMKTVASKVSKGVFLFFIHANFRY